MFLSLSSHGQWSVGNVTCVFLVGLKGHKECSTPLFALNDRSDGAVLACGVEHRQGLCVTAAHMASEIHHLKTEGSKSFTTDKIKERC